MKMLQLKIGAAFFIGSSEFCIHTCILFIHLQNIFLGNVVFLKLPLSMMPFV